MCQRACCAGQPLRHAASGFVHRAGHLQHHRDAACQRLRLGFDVATLLQEPLHQQPPKLWGTENPGATFLTHVPGTSQGLAPPTTVRPSSKSCPRGGVRQLRLHWDHSAIDPDGDELVYSFCAPWTAAEQAVATGTTAPSPTRLPPHLTTTCLIERVQRHLPHCLQPGHGDRSRDGVIQACRPNLVSTPSASVCPNTATANS